MMFTNFTKHFVNDSKCFGLGRGTTACINHMGSKTPLNNG